MEALNFLKFWKASSATQKELNKPINGAQILSSIMKLEEQFDDDDEEEEGEDSFIDLELTLPDFAPKQQQQNDPTLLLLSKRKVNPIDQQQQQQPQSPSPKSKASIFNKPTSKNQLCTVNFKIEDYNNPTKKFISKEAIQKYLKLIKFKPLRRNSNRGGVFYDEFAATSSSSVASSPAPAMMFSPAPGMKERQQQQGFRVVCRHLKKSRSASSATARVAMTPGRRSDDSLMLHNDGIQSAIMHCKKSLNSSTDSSLLSRCTSDSSHEKMYFSSSRDSSVSTSSDYSTERSSISSGRHSSCIEERI
ncbi:hypothetical protein ACFE04_029018 [Oxalis oulophora]